MFCGKNYLEQVRIKLKRLHSIVSSRHRSPNTNEGDQREERLIRFFSILSLHERIIRSIPIDFNLDSDSNYRPSRFSLRVLLWHPNIVSTIRYVPRVCGMGAKAEAVANIVTKSAIIVFIMVGILFYIFCVESFVCCVFSIVVLFN